MPFTGRRFLPPTSPRPPDARPEDVTAGDPSAYVLRGGDSAHLVIVAVVISLAVFALAASGSLTRADLPIVVVGVIVIAGLVWFASRLRRRVSLAVGPLGIYLRDQNGRAAVHPWPDVRSVRVFRLVHFRNAPRGTRRLRTLAVATELTDAARAGQRAVDRGVVEEVSAGLPSELRSIVGEQWDEVVGAQAARTRVVSPPFVAVDRVRLRRRALEAAVARYAPSVPVLDGPLLDLTTRWNDVLTGGRLILGIARSWSSRRPPSRPGPRP